MIFCLDSFIYFEVLIVRTHFPWGDCFVIYWTQLDAYHNDVMTYLVIGLLSLNKNGNTFKVRQCIYLIFQVEIKIYIDEP